MDKNAQIYKNMQDQDELDDDKEIDAALNTIKKEEQKVENKQNSTDTEKQQAVQTQKKVLDAFLHQRILL